HLEKKDVDHIPLHRRTLEIIQKSLWNVVNTRKGTAWRSRVEGLHISGKTGTAQVIGRKENKTEDKDKKRLAKYKDHAWFVAYAPAPDPEIAVAVVVEHGEHGSSAAAPIAKALIQYYLMPEGKAATPAAGRTGRIERH
ncbi:MAG: penicillin-binding protein 2, partial [Deltaproteobacteria bacterium]|nr:penicillin-binding protein 2 [Deltaproteobacteria bacterium]